MSIINNLNTSISAIPSDIDHSILNYYDWSNSTDSDYASSGDLWTTILKYPSFKLFRSSCTDEDVDMMLPTAVLRDSAPFDQTKVLMADTPSPPILQDNWESHTASAVCFLGDAAATALETSDKVAKLGEKKVCFEDEEEEREEGKRIITTTTNIRNPPRPANIMPVPMLMSIPQKEHKFIHMQHHLQQQQDFDLLL